MRQNKKPIKTGELKTVIGRNALVGAGAVVTRSVPENAVVGGSPAKVLKMIDDLRCPYGLIDKPYS